MNWNEQIQKTKLSNLLLKNIHPQWKPFFKTQINKPYFKNMYNQLKQQITNNTDTYILPNPDKCFRVFQYPIDNIKVIILGQDPYYRLSNGHPQACGLSFSIDNNIKRRPASLINILKECNNPNRNGNLTDWSEQGVFLLNTALTVLEGKPKSHMSIWNEFTDNVITYISSLKQFKVFLLFGNPAHKKEKIIHNNKYNCIIKTSHPSPLSANRGFLGSNCFSMCNQELENKKLTKIIW